MAKSAFGGKRFQWDSKAVMEAVGRVKAEALRLSGAAIQKTAKRSMKKPAKTAKRQRSLPGEPPRVHTGALKNSIRFAWDGNSRSVVIGPIPFHGKSAGAKALERGGKVNVKTSAPDAPSARRGRKLSPAEWRQFKASPQGQAWMQQKKEERKAARRITVQIGIKPRPAMKPALDKEIVNIPKTLQKAKRKFNN